MMFPGNISGVLSEKHREHVAVETSKKRRSCDSYVI